MRIDLPIFGAKARPLIGLDISASAIKMVELSGGVREGIRVDRYAIEPLARDLIVDGNIASLEACTEAVRRAWKRLSTPTRNVAMALPSAAVITKKIIVQAGLREDDLEAQVESEANQYIPFPLDEVNLDFQVIGPAPSSPDEIEVLIAASRKERVEDRVAVAEGAGLKPLVMDVDAAAALAAFALVARQLPERGRDRLVALVDIGANSTHLAVLKNGSPVYIREQAFGGNQLTQDIARRYGMSFDEAEAAKCAGTLPDDCASELLRPFVDVLAQEVARALQFFYTSTQFDRVHHIVLAGGCTRLAGAEAAVAERTGIETLVANPFAGMSLSDRVRAHALPVDAPSLLVACGLALRRFDE